MRLSGPDGLEDLAARRRGGRLPGGGPNAGALHDAHFGFARDGVLELADEELVALCLGSQPQVPLAHLRQLFLQRVRTLRAAPVLRLRAERRKSMPNINSMCIQYKEFTI